MAIDRRRPLWVWGPVSPLLPKSDNFETRQASTIGHPFHEPCL